MLNKIKLTILNNIKLIETIIIILLIGLLFINNKPKEEEEEIYTNRIYTEVVYIEKEEEKKEEFIVVDIKGYVNKPGVYKFKKDDDKRIKDLINNAGGLKSNSDTSILNLSKKLKDEMVVIIYSKQQVKDFIKVKEELKEEIKECSKKNDACIKENDIELKDENNEENSKTTEILLININTASKEELMTLNGIGESKANSIIEYRNEKGAFNSIEDIKNVSGIGESQYSKIKDYITI